MGARERWNQGDFTDSALVGARQRWPAMIQVVMQVSFWPIESPYAGAELRG